MITLTKVARILRAIANELEHDEPEALAAAKPKKRSEAANAAGLTRGQISRMIDPAPSKPVVEEEEPLNDWQRLHRKFDYRPFDLESSRRVFNGDRMKMLEILKYYQTEKLAMPIDDNGNEWILLRA